MLMDGEKNNLFPLIATKHQFWKRHWRLRTKNSNLLLCVLGKEKDLKRGDKFIPNYTIILLCSASNKPLEVLSANSSVKKIIA